jgi:hypothetical protein
VIGDQSAPLQNTHILKKSSCFANNNIRRTARTPRGTRLAIANQPAGSEMPAHYYIYFISIIEVPAEFLIARKHTDNK